MPDPSPRTGGAFCPDCRGHRLHEVRTVIEDGTGKTTRNLVCSACETTTRLGVCCPRCGDVRLRTKYTRHRGGTTVRSKACLACGHRVRTVEVIEAGAIAAPAPKT